MKAILILRPTLDSPEIAIEPLPSLAGVKALIDQTVAVGLFDRVLHLRHLRFLAALSGLVPVYQLLYPHNYGCLPKVYRALAGL
jgi:inorganic pyrophosphatase